MVPEWVSQIIKVMNGILPKSFVGKIEINCVNGHVGNVNVSQSFKEENSK